MNAQSKITAARTELVLSQPFWGSLVLGLKMKEDATCKTAWTNGREIGYNPRFIDSLTVTETQALLAHEVSHVANGHPWRRDGRDMKQWNVACDLAINGDLSDAGFKLPKGGLMPDSTQAGKSSEWIYARLPESPNGGGSGQPGSGQGDDSRDGNGDPAGEVRDAPTGPDEDGDPAPSQEDWKQRTAAAAQAAKMQGKMPAGMQRAIEQALRPRIDVRSLLLRFFSERSTGDYSWSRPNPRYLSQGLYLPALESKTLGEIAVYIDTSGSMDPVSLRYARSVTESVIDECNPLAVTVYYGGADVCHVDRFEQGEPLTWNPKGGGGTSFVPALEAIEKQGNVVCAVFITDLDGTFPSVSPSFPTLWLATEDGHAPFGETVYIDR